MEILGHQQHPWGLWDNFLAYAAKHKARVNQLYFIGELLQAKVKNGVFVKLDSRYVDSFHNIQITLEGPWYY